MHRLPFVLFVLGFASPGALAAQSLGEQHTFPDSAAPACPMPSVETAEWSSIQSRVAPIAFRLPPGYEERRREDEYSSSIQDWTDSSARSWISVRIGRPGSQAGVRLANGKAVELTAAELDSAGHRAQAAMRARPTSCGTELDDQERQAGVTSSCSHPTVQLTTCQERISHQTVWIGSGRATGYAAGFFVAWANWEVQPGVWVSVSGTVPTRDRQVQVLRMIRTVQTQ